MHGSDAAETAAVEIAFFFAGMNVYSSLSRRAARDGQPARVRPRARSAAWCEQLGEKAFRATQLFRWIHQRGARDFAAMTDLAKSLRDKLVASRRGRGLPVVSEQVSADGTIKWLFDVGAGNAVETVFIPEDDRGTLCISSQAGCAVGCRFCSTGHQGFSRNLTTARSSPSSGTPSSPAPAPRPAPKASASSPTS